MIIGGATVNQIPLDWKNNVDNILAAINQAQSEGVRILGLPELCLTGYGCEDLFLSEWVPVKAWKHLLTIVPKCTNITVSIGIPVIYSGKTYNGACVISNGKILGISLKQNLAKDGVHYEHRWFEEWPANKIVDLGAEYDHVQAGDIVYEVEGVRFGFEICEDAWRKTNRPGYRLCERNVDLILNPSASHFAMSKSELREKEVVIDGSEKFNCVYLFTNLLGNEAGRMIYDGDIIIGQNGKLVAVNKRLSFKRFNVVSCEVDFKDPGKTVAVKSLDTKEKNEELAQAASLALYDYLRKSKSKGFVLSLSGGADSSLCAILVAEMVKRGIHELGWENFHDTIGIMSTGSNQEWRKTVYTLLTCAYQGTKNSSAETLFAAKSLAESIGAKFLEWKIDEEVNSYTTKIETAIGRKLSWETDDVALQNIQARSRSPIIWMLANLNRSILLTTSNRSEGDVGYATMDGDTSGSLAPIAGLSKPFILQWLKWAEQSLSHSGLKAVNNLQPTAELRPTERHQTDETDLMPYIILEEIEHHAILNRKSPLQVYHAMVSNVHNPNLKEYVVKFFRMWAQNQWKRERLAPSFHFDDLNVDPRSWCRFPIISSGFQEELKELEQS
jgi:NAD+ synthase (glutamine-hydrolysing)